MNFKGVFLLITFIFSLFSVSSQIVFDLEEFSQEDNISQKSPIINLDKEIRSKITTLYYVPTDPIYIDGNFSDTAIARGWSGSGTEGQPYFIDNIFINGSNSVNTVEIRNTDDYFEIKNSYFIYGDYGLYFENVSHGKLINDSFSTCSQGLYLEYSEDVLISENVIKNIDSSGIEITYSKNMTISNTNVTDNSGTGIRLEYSNNTGITQTNITKNGDVGIYIEYSENNTVENNLIDQNDGEGLELRDSNNITVSSNRFIFNSQEGIYLDTVHESKIVDNEINGSSEYGVHIYNSNYNLISRNYLVNNYDGIKLDQSSNNSLIANEIKTLQLQIFEELKYDLFLDECENTTISDNILQIGMMMDGSELKHFDQTLVSNNTLDNKPLIFWVDQDTGIAPDNVGQIFLVNCSSITISDQNFSNVTVGILSAFTKNSVFDNNTIINGTDNSYAIFIVGSNDSEVSNNIISDTDQGLYVKGSTNFLISNNSISNVDGEGILLESSENLILKNNSISDCHKGIHIQDSDNNIIGNNTLIDNSQSSISISSSENCTISNNTIINGRHGVYLSSSTNNSIISNNITACTDYGMFIEYSSNNSIMNNNFEDTGLFLHGTQLNQFIQKKVTNNFVNQDPLIFWQNNVSGTVPASAGQVILVNCTSVLVTSQDISQASVGIQIHFSSNITIQENVLSSHRYGIYLRESDNCTILSNNVTSTIYYAISLSYSHNHSIAGNRLIGNSYGIRPEYSENITISSNWIESSSTRGIGSYLGFNLTITNNDLSGTQYGIYLQQTPNCTILNNVISGSSDTYGIYLPQCENSTIWNNTISGFQRGIFVRDRGKCDIANNTISNNSYGIYLSSSERNSIDDNVFLNGGIFIDGNQLKYYLQSIGSNNTLNGGDIVYWENTTNGLINSSEKQIILVNCTSIIVSNLDLTYTSVGILAASCENSSFVENDISNNIYGIYFWQSENCTIANNTANDDSIGINLRYSHNNTIFNNTISGTSDHGIYLFDGDDSFVKKNRISNPSGDGIQLESSTNCSLINNTITNGNSYGIELSYSSISSLIGNNITNCNNYAMRIYRSGNSVIDSNTFYNCGLSIEGNLLGDYSQESVINNFVNGKAIVFMEDESQQTVPNDSGQLILINCTSLLVTKQTWDTVSIGLQTAYCTNLVVSNNSATNNTYGFYLKHLKDSLVQNNTFIENKIGSYLYTSENTTIIENTASFNEESIQLFYSTNCSIISNKVNNSTKYGIRFDNCENGSISDNVVTNSTEAGIYINSDESHIYRNLILSSNELGLYVTNSKYNLLQWNVIAYCGSYGISVKDSSFNDISWNDFFENNVDDTSQGEESTSETGGVYNLIYYNYWEDWVAHSTDADSNGILDDPYLLTGTSLSQDHSPLASPYHLSKPTITSPNGGENYPKGYLTIIWNPSTDLLSHELKYSIYYSTDGGYNWSPIVSDLNITSYFWNASSEIGFLNSSSYKIKVTASCNIGFSAFDTSDDNFTLQNLQHGLSEPTVISPNGGETLRGEIMISWDASVDNWEHTVNYSVFYSADNGSTWKSLVEGLTNSSINWNTRTVVDGENYLVKVEAYCSEGLMSLDISDGTFIIKNQEEEELDIMLLVAIVIPVIIVISGISFIIIRKRRSSGL